MSKHLAIAAHARGPGREVRHAKGWTPERRARQAARARLMQPWRHSTGPRTDAGKVRVAMNALRHGYRGRTWLLRARRIRNAIRLCANTVLLVRVLRRQNDRAASPALQSDRVHLSSLEKEGLKRRDPGRVPGERRFGEGSFHPK